MAGNSDNSQMFQHLHKNFNRLNKDFEDQVKSLNKLIGQVEDLTDEEKRHILSSAEAQLKALEKTTGGFDNLFSSVDDYLSDTDKEMQQVFLNNRTKELKRLQDQYKQYATRLEKGQAGLFKRSSEFITKMGNGFNSLGKELDNFIRVKLIDGLPRQEVEEALDTTYKLQVELSRLNKETLAATQESLRAMRVKNDELAKSFGTTLDLGITKLQGSKFSTQELLEQKVNLRKAGFANASEDTVAQYAKMEKVLKESFDGSQFAKDMRVMSLGYSQLNANQYAVSYGNVLTSLEKIAPQALEEFKSMHQEFLPLLAASANSQEEMDDMMKRNALAAKRKEDLKLQSSNWADVLKGGDLSAIYQYAAMHGLDAVAGMQAIDKGDMLTVQKQQEQGIINAGNMFLGGSGKLGDASYAVARRMYANAGVLDMNESVDYQKLRDGKAIDKLNQEENALKSELSKTQALDKAVESLHVPLKEQITNAIKSNKYLEKILNFLSDWNIGLVDVYLFAKMAGGTWSALTGGISAIAGGFSKILAKFGLGTAAKGAAGAAGTASTAAGAAASAGSKALKLLGGSVLGGLASGAVSLFNGEGLTKAGIRTALGTAGSWGGGALGSLFGPGLGTAAGAIAGGYLADKLADAIFETETYKKFDKSKPVTHSAIGEAFVPGNNLPYLLHRGERVLTKEENKAYTGMSSSVIRNYAASLVASIDSSETLSDLFSLSEDKSKKEEKFFNSWSNSVNSTLTSINGSLKSLYDFATKMSRGSGGGGYFGNTSGGFNGGSTPADYKIKVLNDAPTHSGDQAAFVDKFLEGAIRNYAKYGILPSTTLGQGALESGWAKKESGKNNFFGMKGKGTIVTTQEDYGNGLQTVREEFQDFATAAEGVEAYGKLLNKYEGLSGAKDYYTAAWNLQHQSDGQNYATDKNYVNKLVSTIESNGFQYYDNPEVMKRIAAAKGWNIQGLGKPAAIGADYVPRDNMLFRLHQGERVLTREENKLYTSNLGGYSRSNSIGSFSNMNTMEIINILRWGFNLVSDTVKNNNTTINLHSQNNPITRRSGIGTQIFRLGTLDV